MQVLSFAFVIEKTIPMKYLLRCKFLNLNCRYNAPWAINTNESKLYIDTESGEKKFEPQRNDDRVNSHNRYILQLWRENIDWQPVLLAHVVIKYIAKYASKVEKISQTYHQMLTWLENIENLDDFASKVYKKL